MHVFQSFWFGNALSPYEKLCLRSFIDHGHAFDLYTYSPDLGVPQGVQLRDANEILDESEYFVYEDGIHTGSHAAFSNLFRYALLAMRGGWWVDTDVVCLSKDIPVFDEFFAWEETDLVNGAVLFFRERDPIMLRSLDEARSIGKTPGWGKIGYELLTRILKDEGRLARAQPAASCYPLHFEEFLDPLLPEKINAVSERVSASYFLHLWNEMLRLHRIPKTMLPPSGSFLRDLADTHKVDGWRAEHDAGFLQHAVLLQRERAGLEEHIEYLTAELQKVQAAG